MGGGTAVRKKQSPLSPTTTDLEEQIRARAHQLWRERGAPEGSALQDWLDAERAVLREYGLGTGDDTTP